MADDRQWEELLRRGLDARSDLGDEQPPSVAGLQLLVAEVQREQRRQTARDLALFWLCGAVVVGGAVLLAVREPVYFLVWQGVAAAGGAVAALLWRRAGQKEAAE